MDALYVLQVKSFSKHCIARLNNYVAIDKIKAAIDCFT